MDAEVQVNETRKRYRVVCALIVRGRSVFCCRRGPGRALEGFWEFPGGKIEPGEDPRHALEREIREELMAKIEVGDHLASCHHDYEDFSIDMEAFVCSLEGREPTLTEHTESRWLAFEELDSIEWAPADMPIVAAAKSKLPN